jgi:hypothetical protein
MKKSKKSKFKDIAVITIILIWFAGLILLMAKGLN